MSILGILVMMWLPADSRDDLLAQIEQAGVTGFQPVEIGLIASGVPIDELPKMVAEYEAFVMELTSEVDSGKSAKKMARQLFSELFSKVKTHDEDSHKLTDLLGSKTYSTVTAAFLFYDAAQRLGLDVQLVETPIHVFAVFNDNKKETDIEFFDRNSYDKKYSDYQGYGRDLLDAGVTDQQALANIQFQNEFESIRKQRKGISLREAAAILLSKAAAKYGPSDVNVRIRDLKLVNQLAPESWFGKGNFDRELHRHIGELYKSKEVLLGLKLATVAAQRFPDYTEYSPFLFNFAVLRVQELDKTKEFSKAFLVADEVKPLLAADVRPSFNDIYPTLHHNFAVDLFNNKSYAMALEHAEGALAGYKQMQEHYASQAESAKKLEEIKVSLKHVEELVPNAQELWVMQLLDEGDHVKAQQVLADLAVNNPARADQIKTRLDQQALKSLYESGNYRDALALATKRISDDNGQQNFLATFNRFILDLLSKKQFEESLKELDGVPEIVAGDKAVKDLRYNTYIEWLNRFKNDSAKKQLPIYQRMFADKRLELTDAERKALISNHVAVFAGRVEKAIADGRYNEASDLLAEGEKLYPDDVSLQAWRKKVRTIQERLAE